METTYNKKQYRSLLAILQKVKGRTYKNIANEQGVSSRSVQRWVAAFTRGGWVGTKHNRGFSDGYNGIDMRTSKHTQNYLSKDKAGVS
jgi:transposase